MDNGAIVHIEYDLYNAESGDLIETTREEIAKEHDVFDDARTYEPMITVIGEGRLIGGFEAHLADADADTEPDLDARCKTFYTRYQIIDTTYLMLDIRYPITRTPRRHAGPHQEVHPSDHESCQEHYSRALLQSIEHL